MVEEKLRKAYDASAEEYLYSRTVGTGISGFQNREIEQPIMFSLVPHNLHGKRLLDLGCGPGIHLQEYLRRGAEAFGIDISEKMIQFARKQCPEGKLEVSSCYSLPYANSFFDIATASFVLDHLEDFDKGVAEVRRILKPDGQFIFSAPHPTRTMFRDSEKDTFIPTHSYFDSSVIMCNIVNKGKIFPGFARTLEDYITSLLQQHFQLVAFQENKPNPDWPKKYPDLDTNYLKIPFLCFFSWRKMD